tara:strand:+ start:441 stop:752 length:312 start_codon:yes stop_codon:yes gene_type:complete
MNKGQMELPKKVIGITNLKMLENAKKIQAKGAPRIWTTFKVNTRTDKEQKSAYRVKRVLKNQWRKNAITRMMDKSSEEYFRKMKKDINDDIYFPPEESEPPHY